MWQRIKEFFCIYDNGKVVEKKATRFVEWIHEVEVEVRLYGLNWKKTVVIKEEINTFSEEIPDYYLADLSSNQLIMRKFIKCSKTGRAYNMLHVVALKAKEPVIVAKRQLTL